MCLGVVCFGVNVGLLDGCVSVMCNWLSCVLMMFVNVV